MLQGKCQHEHRLVDHRKQSGELVDRGALVDDMRVGHRRRPVAPVRRSIHAQSVWARAKSGPPYRTEVGSLAKKRDVGASTSTTAHDAVAPDFAGWCAEETLRPARYRESGSRI